MIDDAITELAPLIGVREACVVTGRPQASHYRRHRQSPAPVRPRRERKPQPRALAPAERAEVRAVLNSPEHVDKAPATVYHELLDQGTYLASVSTVYRVLREHDEGACHAKRVSRRCTKIDWPHGWSEGTPSDRGHIVERVVGS